jgi:hypothetical protein
VEIGSKLYVASLKKSILLVFFYSASTGSKWMDQEKNNVIFGLARVIASLMVVQSIHSTLKESHRVEIIQ